MGVLRTIFLNRNSILVFAVIAGLIIGDYAIYIKDYNIYILAVTMTFSMTGLDLSLLNSIKKVFKPFFMGIILNYLVFGLILMPVAWLLMPSKELFYGFVVIVAAPPGVAVIPFSYILKGKIDYAIIGVTGAFVASIFIAPLLVNIFAKSEGINPLDIFYTMIQLIVIPLVIAQILRVKHVFSFVKLIRGKIVDWGFAIIIFVAVGINREVFFSNPQVLLLIVVTLGIAIFGVGLLYEVIAKRIGIASDVRIPQNMLVTIKSSGFSVFTALTIFGQQAAIPSAVLAVMVLLYLIFLSLRVNKGNQ